MSDLEKLLSIEWLPLGTLINAFCILMGGLVGLRLCRQLTDRTQYSIRKFLAVLTFLASSYMIANGLNTGWKALGSFWKFLGLCGIALLAISFGNLFGTWMKLQEHLDKLGQAAKDRFAKLQKAMAEDVCQRAPQRRFERTGQTRPAEPVCQAAPREHELHQLPLADLSVEVHPIALIDQRDTELLLFG